MGEFRLFLKKVRLLLAFPLLIALTACLAPNGSFAPWGTAGSGAGISPGTFTWIAGSQSANQSGAYPSYAGMGGSSATYFPGSRVGASNWVDSSGNLWLFGGEGSSGYLNDLWEYATGTNQWTWVGGSNSVSQTGSYPSTVGQGGSSATYYPGARYRASNWVDLSGNLWVFGGYTTAGTSGNLDDLWEYTVSNNQWTWVSGSNVSNQGSSYPASPGLGGSSTTYYPGGRQGALTWVDHSGNFWLFGGSCTGGLCDDLWEYTISNNNWTWVAGSSTASLNGSYPATVGQGGSSTTYYPGGRGDSSTWVDASGNLWLLGGYGYGASGGAGYLNDLWEYSISSNQWTWIAGADFANQNGSYPSNTAEGGSSATYYPGGRGYSASWVDSSGNLWLFGGNGYSATGTFGSLNDLWEYNVSNNQWNWIAGSSAATQFGSYPSTVGAGGSSVTYSPGGRWGESIWASSGGIWILGGNGYAATSNGYLNDLWEFRP